MFLFLLYFSSVCRVVICFFYVCAAFIRFGVIKDNNNNNWANLRFLRCTKPAADRNISCLSRLRPMN